MARRDYRHIDKDPIIDLMRTEAQRQYGQALKDGACTSIANDAGISPSTVNNWFKGKTKRPQSLTTRFALEALGVKTRYFREDGTEVRMRRVA